MKKIDLPVKILIAMTLGVIVGLLMQNIPNIAQTYIRPFGVLFINLIKMVIIPLVFSSLILGVASIGDLKVLRRIGAKTLAYYMLTTAIAVLIGLLLGAIMNPGAGLDIPANAEVAKRDVPPIVTTLLNIIPANPLQGLVRGNILQVIAFALFLGIASITLQKEQSATFLNFFRSIEEIMCRITNWVMYLAPYGVFALMVPTVANYGIDVLRPLALVILAVYLGIFLHVSLVYSFAVNFFAKINPLKFFQGISSAAATAFTTTSSSATLPVTMKSVREKFGVSDKISSFILPLGATINMDGTSLYLGVCALFVAQVYNIDLTVSQLGIIILTATLGSIGTAGVPGAGFIMLTLVLESVGLPLEALALILGIDRILDMGRTAVNVIGDASCAIVVAASEKEIAAPDLVPELVEDIESETPLAQSSS